jgi:chemotaxis protein CheD
MTTPVLADTPAAHEKRTHVVQGQFAVSADPGEVLTTILGSCVAACLRDPVAGIGGMNHFLLPGEIGRGGLRYGVNAMELLINELLKLGARRDRLEAKIFGGARMVAGLSDIGCQNATFAESYFRDEGVQLLGGSTGGSQARRLQFWPVSGRTRQLFLSDIEGQKADRPSRPAPVGADDGAVELF